MRQAGMMDEATYDYVLTSDYAALLTEEFGRNPIINDEAAFDIHPPPLNSTPSTLPTRPPVVTIMGHVDHGKTTLLDTLRSSSVAKGEAGGITQHIGAFSVPVPGGECGQRSITFLDTPGHAAFSAMRARGASVTDIVVLVVAADDGIMPQTKEVINLIKKDDGKVGVVVAINKVDKPGCDIEAVQKALMAENIQLEALGGDIPSVNVSGLTGEGLSELVETLSLMAEMQDLRAERAGPVQGYVLESKVLKGLGPVATVLILRGCLMPGTHIISGVSHGKVRVMNDPTGAAVKAAYPGMAITVCGWKTLPQAGDEVLQGTEAEIKKALSNRLRKSEVEASLVDVEAINSTRRLERERRELGVESTNESPDKDTDPEGPKELRLIIKADVSGSAEAVVGALQGIGNKEAMTKIVSSSVGDITESDVMMAKATGGIIVAFSVSVPRAIQSLAAQNGISICSSSIIYRLMDDIKERVIGLLPVITETKVTGEATVLQLFDIQLKAKQTKKVAGCRVINGIVEKIRFARVIRDGSIIHEGTLDTMRHLKKDVTEVRKGSECGLSFNGFSDLRDGDLIQMYQKIEKPGIL
ncbi:P-loop containing nucleoside triphosphate hydrolase protein [Infundibulicybe gibba]|nr:P-loop containing nucleoside triphosphate hydrolase protein [Infundibulicybe gibba]